MVLSCENIAKTTNIQVDVKLSHKITTSDTKYTEKKIFRPKPINFCLQKHNYEALNEESLNVSNLEFHPMKSTPQAHNILEDNNVNKHH